MAEKKKWCVGCGAAAGGELTGTGIVCTPQTAARQPAPAGLAAAGGEIAGADQLYTLRAATRQPALAGCGAAADGVSYGSGKNIHFSGRRPAAGFGQRGDGGAREVP